jgi:hypothetical protein
MFEELLVSMVAGWVVYWVAWLLVYWVARFRSRLAKLSKQRESGPGKYATQ